MSKKLRQPDLTHEDIPHSQEGDVKFEVFSVAKNEAIVKTEVFETCQLSCPTCGEVFQAGRDLEMHSCPQGTTQINYPLPCSLCGKTIPLGNKEAEGQCCTIVKPLAKYSCNRCGRTFDRRFNFERHIKRDRDCNPDLEKFQVTSRSSSRELRCPHPGCRRTYLKPSEFTKHVKVHSSERPITCARCGNGYKLLKTRMCRK
ncbi:zinc finger protein 813-like [Folsomia candida]|uniref:zinc finger protein 813-like n=1 Tax=Folsomia candida TaxID=158441 RepID=UPI00160513EA|nr:zinc finger protein 813-like [Folsomia candida]